MKTIRVAAVLAATAGALIVVGCAHHPSPTATPVAGTQAPSGVTSKQNAADMRVVDELSNAQCEHEQKCGKIGAGKKYDSYQVCLDEARGHTANGINADNCPRGIDENAVNNCLSAVRDQSCSFRIERLLSSNPCSPGSLCIPQ
jgi:hypothetical protein